MSQVDTDPTDPLRANAILARFPGPVRLYVTGRKRFAIFAVALFFVVLCAWLLFGDHVRPPSWGDTIIAWFGLLLSGFAAVVSAILMWRPGVGYLMLDADGFVTSYLFRDVRTHWRDVSDFRLERWPGSINDQTCMYDVPGAPFGKRGFRILPDNYGLTERDLVWLMNAWRARALERL